MTTNDSAPTQPALRHMVIGDVFYQIATLDELKQINPNDYASFSVRINSTTYSITRSQVKERPSLRKWSVTIGHGEIVDLDNSSHYKQDMAAIESIHFFEDWSEGIDFIEMDIYGSNETYEVTEQAQRQTAINGADEIDPVGALVVDVDPPAVFEPMYQFKNFEGAKSVLALFRIQFADQYGYEPVVTQNIEKFERGYRIQRSNGDYSIFKDANTLTRWLADYMFHGKPNFAMLRQ